MRGDRGWEEAGGEGGDDGGCEECVLEERVGRGGEEGHLGAALLGIMVRALQSHGACARSARCRCSSSSLLPSTLPSLSSIFAHINWASFCFFCLISVNLVVVVLYLTASLYPPFMYLQPLLSCVALSSCCSLSMPCMRIGDEMLYKSAGGFTIFKLQAWLQLGLLASFVC